MSKKVLPGAVVAQYRTVKGRRYGPYWFRVWREEGRLRKEYVPAWDLERVRAACEAWRSAVAVMRPLVRRKRKRRERALRKARREALGLYAWPFEYVPRSGAGGEA